MPYVILFSLLLGGLAAIPGYFLFRLLIAEYALLLAFATGLLFAIFFFLRCLLLRARGKKEQQRRFECSLRDTTYVCYQVEGNRFSNSKNDYALYFCEDQIICYHKSQGFQDETIQLCDIHDVHFIGKNGLRIPHAGSDLKFMHINYYKGKDLMQVTFLLTKAPNIFAAYRIEEYYFNFGERQNFSNSF